MNLKNNIIGALFCFELEYFLTSKLSKSKCGMIIKSSGSNVRLSDLTSQGCHHQPWDFKQVLDLSDP